MSADADLKATVQVYMLKIGKPGKQPMQMEVRVRAFPGKQTKWRWDLRSGANIKNDALLGDTVTLTALDTHDNPTTDFVPDAAGRKVVRVIHQSDATAQVNIVVFVFGEWHAGSFGSFQPDPLSFDCLVA